MSWVHRGSTFDSYRPPTDWLRDKGNNGLQVHEEYKTLRCDLSVALHITFSRMQGSIERDRRLHGDHAMYLFSHPLLGKGRGRKWRTESDRPREDAVGIQSGRVPLLPDWA